MPTKKKSKTLEQNKLPFSDAVAPAESAPVPKATTRSPESEEEHNVRSRVETGMRPDHFQKGNQPGNDKPQ